jgi:signal transduction histidine kinase
VIPLLPAPGIDDIPELVSRTRDNGLEVCYQASGEQTLPVSDIISLAAYRIVQESLTNARRHAWGAPVHVSVDFDAEEVTILVENPVTASVDDRVFPGLGLRGMAERTISVGGQFDAGQTSGRFVVRATLPYSGQ